MKPTRRGFFGIIGGIVGAALVGIKPASSTASPTFSAGIGPGPPWRRGDVLFNVRTRQKYLVKSQREPERNHLGTTREPFREPPVLNMRNTGDFAVLKKPDNWRAKILQLYPNTEAPLLKLLREGKRTMYAGLILVPSIDCDVPTIRLQDVKDADKVFIRIGRMYPEGMASP